MDQQDILRQPFDIQTHKKNFINYLEVIILEDGTIKYAVPSHQEFLINFACDKLNITRDELSDLCPREYYFEFNDWLCIITNCIAVYQDGMVGKANDQQKESLQQLADERLYIGRIN